MIDTTPLCFFVPGPPQAWQRPRRNRAGAFFTPKRTGAYEDTVRAHALAAAHGVGWRPLKGAAYSVTIRLRFADRRNRDVDNCVKSIFDGLNKVAFVDDSQVAILSTVRVRGHAEPGAWVTVARCEEPFE